MKKTLLFVSLIILVTISSCGGKASVPSDVAEVAEYTWGRYIWAEQNFGVWRGGGWHLAPEDKYTEFEITRAQKGKLPDELKVLMSVSPTQYQDNVWCVSYKPPLYYGVEPDSPNDIKSETMVFFQKKGGAWIELGNIKNERWVNFLYPPNTYYGIYMGIAPTTLEKVGCSGEDVAKSSSQ